MRCRPDADAIARAAALIQAAERPLILAGGGVHLSRADGVLTEFAEAFGIPVAHTMSGKGAIACTNPLSVGLFGRYSRIANDMIEAADCLLVVGCKLGEIATRRHSLLSDATPLIHLDRCPEEFGRTARATIALWGDAAAGIADLHQELGKAAGHRCPHTGCEFWRPARLKAEIRAVKADVKHERWEDKPVPGYYRTLAHRAPRRGRSFMSIRPPPPRSLALLTSNRNTLYHRHPYTSSCAS